MGGLFVINFCRCGVVGGHHDFYLLMSIIERNKGNIVM
jgi:hypothetical protein